jgi:hypothetical protein
VAAQRPCSCCPAQNFIACSARSSTHDICQTPRGLSAAATAGGLGTASLTSKEPEALPYCALSYALVGITSTVLMSSPLVRDAIVAIVSG